MVQNHIRKLIIFQDQAFLVRAKNLIQQRLYSVLPPVRFGSIVRDTTIPEVVVFGIHTAGSVESEDITAGSFSGVSSLSYSQRSFPAVHHYFCCQAVVVRPRESLLVPVTL